MNKTGRGRPGKAERSNLTESLNRAYEKVDQTPDAFFEVLQRAALLRSTWPNPVESESTPPCPKTPETNVNSLMIISPYRSQGVWAFDDAAKGLEREPFVAETNGFIDALTASIHNAEGGFRLLFSAKPFPGFTLSFRRVREEYEGNWYACEQLGGEGWLCPALFKYFDEAPEQIFVKAEPLG